MALDADTDGEPLRKPNRKAIPPDDWDDLLVSYWRGQPWARIRD